MLLKLFKRKQAPRQRRIGVTLSGGGMRGIAHIGILKALEEFGFKPDIISGTSMGAIVGAFYAYGYTPDEIIQIATAGSYFNRKNFRLGTTGFFKHQMILDLLEKHLPTNSFERLKIPLYVCATELTQGKTEYFCTGELHLPVVASASIPYIFPPVRIGNKIYTDGGVTNNLPIEPIKNQCDVLIGSHVNSIVFDEMKTISARNMFGRILHLALGTTVYEKRDQCDIFVDPVNMTQYGVFNQKSAFKLFELGYRFTCSTLENAGYQRKY